MGCEDYIQNLERIEEMLKSRIPVVWPEDELFIDAEKPPLTPTKRRPRPKTHNNRIDGTKPLNKKRRHTRKPKAK